MPDALPEVYCDRTRIREVVLNLLTNAGRFTESGGVELHVRQDDGQIVVAVKDTGPGIADEDQQRLFKPFGQLDGSIRRRYGGSGLGLVISKRFVEMHNGKMWVESRLGEGATFSFTLPVDTPTMLERSATSYFIPGWEFLQRTRPSQAPDPVVRPRLVVVERGDGMRRFLSRYLDEVEVVCFDALEAALTEMADVPTTALLINAAYAGKGLDAGLDTDGLVERLPPGVPAIACAIQSTDQAARTMGQAAYLIKPVSREALLAALTEVVGGETEKPHTVLVVDDEPDMLRLYGRILTESGRGYRVLRASSGHQAVAVLQHEHVDAVILDLVMPEMDGYAVLAYKQAQDGLRDIPVLLVSALDPSSRPFTSPALTVTCREGLGAPQILACIQALTQVLSTGARPVGPTPREVPPG